MPKKKPSRPNPLREAAEKRPQILEEGTSLTEAGKTMRTLGTRTLPVATDGQLIGRTENPHLDQAAAGHGHDPDMLRVRDSMVRDNACCFDDQSVEEARQIMIERNLQHLPVVDRKKRVIGMVSRQDLDEAAQPRSKCRKADIAPGNLPGH